MRVARARCPCRSTWPRCRRRCCDLTGEVADGWLGTSFVPEGADAYFEYLDAGLARGGRTRADLDVCQGAEVTFAADENWLRTMVTAARRNSPSASAAWARPPTNFYNDAYSRQGWAEVAAAVRERWQAGDRDGAAALVTDDMVLATTLIGTEDMVRDPPAHLARRRRGHRPPLPRRRHPGRPPRQPGPRHRPGPRPGLALARLTAATLLRADRQPHPCDIAVVRCTPM